MSSKYTDSAKRTLATRGSQTAAELARELGISQPTLSRAIKGSTEIVRIGQSRSARYALSQANIDGESNWLLYKVDEQSRISCIGRLHSLCQGEFYFEPENESVALSYLFNGDEHPRLFPDLPWFLDDMRSQGYMGRLLAHKHGPSLGIGTNPETWTIDQALRAILKFGSDTPGNFILGSEAIDLAQYARSQSTAIDESERTKQFDTISQNPTENGEVPNSFAGGEQPKFTACIRRADNSLQQVIVKFSGLLQTDVGQRWAQLLRAENLAANVLKKHGLSTTSSQIVETPERTYLEIERFDRSEQFGRAGTLSLRTIVAGRGEALEQPWSKAALPLIRDGWLSQSDGDQVSRLEWFGHLIGNTDMHLGNLSLYLTPELPLKLCPIYDMLPMAYAPSRMGDMNTKPLTPRLPRPEELPNWRPAAEAAQEFWSELVKGPASTLQFAFETNKKTIESQLDQFSE